MGMSPLLYFFCYEMSTFIRSDDVHDVMKVDKAFCNGWWFWQMHYGWGIQIYIQNTYVYPREAGQYWHIRDSLLISVVG